MVSVSDAIVSVATDGVDLPRRLKNYFIANSSATDSLSLPQCELTFLKEAIGGDPTGTIDDLWGRYLTSLGYKTKHEFWVNGGAELLPVGTSFAPVDPNKDLGHHQGIAYIDSTGWISIDDNEYTRYNADWEVIESNTDPLGDMGITPGSLIDCYVQDSKIWTIRNNEIHAHNVVGLTYSGSDNVALSVSFSASSVSNGPNSNSIYAISFENTTGVNVIKEYNRTTGVFVGDISLSSNIIGAQGLTYAYGRFYVSATNNDIYEVATDGTVETTAVATISSTVTIEGLTFDGTFLWVLFDDSSGLETILKLYPYPTTDQTADGTEEITLVNTGAEQGDTTGFIRAASSDFQVGSGADTAASAREGTYYFWGGTSSAFSYASQLAFVPREAIDQIDAGYGLFDLEWYHRGDDAGSAPYDRGRIVVRFYDENLVQLGVIAPDFITNENTWNLYSELDREIPPNTRGVKIEFQLERLAGSQLNSYIDGVETCTIKWHTGAYVFESDITGWATWLGTPGTIEWLADDSGSHSPGNYEGVLHFAWDSSNDHRIRANFTTLPETDYRFTIELSFEDSGDRVTINAQQANTTTYVSSSPQTTAQTVTLDFTTAAGSEGETTRLSIQRNFPTAQGGAYINKVLLEAV